AAAGAAARSLPPPGRRRAGSSRAARLAGQLLDLRELLRPQAADDVRERRVTGAAGRAGERAADRARQILRFAQLRLVAVPAALALAFEQPALHQPVEHGLHRVVRAAVARRQLLADLFDGARTEAPERRHHLPLQLALDEWGLGHVPSMPAIS